MKGRSAKVVAVERALADVKYIQHGPREDRELDGRKFFAESEENLDGRALRKAIRELAIPGWQPNLLARPRRSLRDREAHFGGTVFNRS